MKKVIRNISICLLVVFSFYYTNLVSNIFINRSDLMQKIESVQSNYEIESVNAQIDDIYIIPGINGVIVDKLNSYYVMKKNDSFNTELFVLKEISPIESYYNHTDLIINKGNSYKNCISLLVINNDSVINYLLSKKIVFNRLITLESIGNNSGYQQINNDFLHYDQVEKLLDKYNSNTNICIVDKSIDTCKTYGKYLVKPSITLSNNQYLSFKSITPGDIILINDNYSLSKVKILLKQIEFENINLCYLDYHISETR